MRMEDRFAEQDKEHVVQVLMMVVLQKLQFVLNMDIVSVLHINLEVQNVVQALEMAMMVRHKLEVNKQMRMEDRFVELDWVHVVLVLMMVVLQKLQYVQNMDIVSVLHINLEVLNVVQALQMLLLEVKEMEMEQKDKFVEQDKVPVVLVL